MTDRDIVRFRLQAQGLAHPTCTTPAAVVSSLIAVQAQDYAGAKWALGIRQAAGERATDVDAEEAMTSGAILRTHLLRPTWHFVTAADIRWLLSLTAPRVHAVNGTQYRRFGIDADIRRRSRAVIERAFRTATVLTRDELKTALVEAGIESSESLHLIALMMAAELDGVICSGPRRARQFTYALLDARVPQALDLPRDEALATLATRYFRTRGPATAHDFSKWSGLSVTDARRGAEAAGTALTTVTIDEAAAWMGAEVEPARTTTGAWLLSIYDELVSSYRDRRAFVSPVVGGRLGAMGNDLTNVVLLDGQIVGTWKRTLAARSAAVDLTLFALPTFAARKRLDAAVGRYGEFLGVPVAATITGDR